jgi:Ankyrin repeats (many copies)
MITKQRVRMLRNLLTVCALVAMVNRRTLAEGDWNLHLLVLPCQSYPGDRSEEAAARFPVALAKAFEEVETGPRMRDLRLVLSLLLSRDNLYRQESEAVPDAIAVMLIHHGAEINGRDEQGLTPLHLSAGYGLHQTVRLLLSRRVDVNARSSFGVTPLRIANPENAALLAEHGADGSATANGWSAFMCVVGHNDLRAVEILIQHGTDVGATDVRGRSVLFYAQVGDTRPNQTALIRLLKQHGARLNMRDKEDLAWYRPRPALQRKSTHTPAVVESFSSLDNLVCRSDAPRSFRVKDKVVFLHRSETGMIYKGRGEVKEVVDDGVMIAILNPKFGVGLDDQVYIVQRDTSPDSLSKFSSANGAATSAFIKGVEGSCAFSESSPPCAPWVVAIRQASAQASAALWTIVDSSSLNYCPSSEELARCPVRSHSRG